MKFDKQPEFHIAVFGFMTAFIWEILQMPFFNVGSATDWEKTWGCTRATFGDVAILLLAYTVVSILKRDRKWMHHPSIWMIGLYLLTGLGITVIIEAIAINAPSSWNWGWQYSELMPMLPGTNIGFIPVLMWLIIPSITLWFARRQPQK